MAPPDIRSVPTLDSSPPPLLPDKHQVKRPGTASSTCNLSNTSIPTLSTTLLVRQLSASSSNATPPARRPVRPGMYPPSSRSALPNPALDPSQDHHRSDSGRSTGSSRSTATTDSFFLPQHPHAHHRRLKDLPVPPSSSNVGDATTRAKSSDAPSSALGLNVSISPPEGTNSLPSAHLFRSKSSVSTTPTSPEEGDGSPLEPPAPRDLPPLDVEELKRDSKLHSQQKDGLDELWKSDYSYGRPSADLLEPSLPPLLRSNAPIPPSRSHSLDPLAAPLDGEDDAAIVDPFSQNDLASKEDRQQKGSATPLVAANLRKLNSQRLQVETSPASTSQHSAVSSSPLLSQASTVQTPTKSNDATRLAVPRPSPHPYLTASSSASSSAIDHSSHPNKSSSSISTSSANEGDKGALVTASKRSSASSNSSFRMTLSRQAKTLRNSFMWSPPSTIQPSPTSQEPNSASPAMISPDSLPEPLSQGPSPALEVGSPLSASNELPPPPDLPQNRGQNAGASRDGESHQRLAAKQQVTTKSPANASGKAPSQKNKPPSLRSSHSSVDARSAHSGPKIESSASKLSMPPSTKQQPTDYSKLEDRPKSRLSSRLMLQNSNWSMKISNLKTKKAGETTVSKPVAPHATVEPGYRDSGRRSKTIASSSTTRIAASTTTLAGSTLDEGNASTVVRTSLKPTSLVISQSSLWTSDRSSTDAQISPSFAETFAFLNSHIDSPEQSPPLLATVIPTLGDVQAVTANDPPKPAASSVTPSESFRDSQCAQAALAPSMDLRLVASSAPSSQRPGSQRNDEEGAEPKETLFDRLADSPEAVYKTLVLPKRDLPLPASQSQDSIAPTSSRISKRFGHKKQMSLGSATMISKSVRKAAVDLEKHASGAPVTSSGVSMAHGRISTRSSFSSVLPTFTPVDEESRFFNALTSPPSEQPPSTNVSPSPDNSVMPTLATVTDFFSHPNTEPISPLLDHPLASQSTASVVTAGVQSVVQPSRSSLGRRLSGVFDASKAQSVRKNLLASPPRSPRADPARVNVLPQRPETSLGFHLRNPLRRERKASLTTVAGQDQKSLLSRKENSNSTVAASRTKTMSPASAIRKMSSSFRLDRATPTTNGPARPDTSLGFATDQSKTPRAFSSSVLAPTKSSLARSIQVSPSLTGTPAARSTPASLLGSPASNRQSRSPQRPSNPPSSFRGASTASSRPSVIANRSPSRPARVKPSILQTKTVSSDARDTQPMADGFRYSASALDSLLSDQTLSTSVAPSQASRGIELPTSPNSNDVRRRRTLSKPMLPPIHTTFAENGAPARPSTAMGFCGGMTSQDRKMSQPTLDMVDDREFLEALEQVRAVHRERIQAQAQEVENKTRLARLGMMSGNHLKTKVSGSMFDDGELADSQIGSGFRNADKSASGSASGTRSDDSKALVAAGSRLRHKRSASADAKLGRSLSISSASQESEKDVDQRQKDIVRAYVDKKPTFGQPTTGLEWGVGKASGKLHDGTFVNDDDWKKEVKALFLIRELVQTERSYARHLGSLLSVIRKMQVAPAGSTNALGIKRKSTSNLFAAYSSAYSGKSLTSAAPPSHVALLRTFLPQLIVLSNALVQRVEDNPTSAGVGAAFDMLSAQLESTFVGWSSVASQAFKDLRSTEAAKGKSPYKIGLVPLIPREATEVGASTTDTSNSSGASSPGSGFRHSTLRMTSLTRPASPVGVRHDPDALSPSDASGATLPVKRSAKRRSTITSTNFIPPSVTVAPAPVMTTSPEHEASADTVRAEAGLAAETNATPSRRFGHSRSQSNIVTPLPTPISAIGPEPWSALSMTPATLASNVAAPSQAVQATGAATKCLTPMDIAIMPTQRIPRYGLMLRDLLRNTPPESLSHVRVQRAIALIQKVALLCDSVAPLSTAGAAPGSGAATPSRANSVLGMTSAESLGKQPSPLLASSAFTVSKRN